MEAGGSEARAVAPGWRVLPWAAAAAVWVGLLGLILVPGLWMRAHHWLPWMMQPTFHDTWIVRLGWDAVAQGLDPLAAPGHPFNYPRIVLLGAKLGGRNLPPAVLGLILAAAAVASLAWVLRSRRPIEALVAAAVIASPPVLLLLERGNLDALALALVVAGLAASFSDRPAWSGPILGAACLLGAALLKLYPAVALLPVVVLSRGPRRRWALAALAVFVAWMMTHTAEISLVMRKTTRGTEAAYGRIIAASRVLLERPLADGDAAASAGRMHAAIRVCFGACVAGMLLAAGLGWRSRAIRNEIQLTARERGFFIAGALVYAGTFLLGANWAYRLVFLTLCVPALWQGIRTRGIQARAWIVLGGVGFILFLPFHLSLGWFLVQQAVEWLTAFALLGGAVALLRPGTRETVCPTPRNP